MPPTYRDCASQLGRSTVDDEGDRSPDDSKRLIRVRSEVGLSLSEKVANQFYRLTWRTPLYAFRLRGRHPLKLLAVPDNALIGSPDAGAAIIAGNFVLRGQIVSTADEVFAPRSHSRGMIDYLHSFDWLADLSAAAPREQSAPIAEALVRKWITQHGDKVNEPAWRADLWAKRIFNWAAYAPLILANNDLVYRSSVLNAMARGSRHLDQAADRAPPGLPHLTAWIGIVMAGLLIAGGKPRQVFGEAGLINAIASDLGKDGGIVCRTPQAQAQAVLLLTNLRNAYLARKLDVPEYLSEVITRAVPPLLSVRLGDGGLSSWQGSAPLPPTIIDAIIDNSGVRTRPLRQPREWGYHRLHAGHTAIIMDAAPPPTGRVTGGGCASTLAFELSDAQHRVIVNCGGAKAGGAYVTAGLADGLRTTAAHSTLIVADSNSTAIHSDGMLGKGVNEVEINRLESETSSRIEASHDGYGARYGVIHRRTIILSSDGREVRGEDVLLPAPKSRKRMAHPFAVRFHLGIEIEATATADALGALLRIDGGALWQFRCRGGTLSLDDSVWIDGEGRPNATTQLVVSGEVPPGGATIGWVLKRAG